MKLIGISGKKQHGKDTVGLIIQAYLDYPSASRSIIKKYINSPADNPTWKIKKFAGKLKEIVAIMINCTTKDLEDEEFKNKVLYVRYEVEDKYIDKILSFEFMEDGLNEQAERIEAIKKQIPDLSFDDMYENITFNKVLITPRYILQKLGTDIGRAIHSNIWVNSLLVNNKDKNLIITDVRFPNEANAIGNREGILIRVNRDGLDNDNHISETSLDDYKYFDYTINNNGTLEDLILSVRSVLKELKLI